MVTEDSTVYYNRSIMGTFTVKLKVVAEWEQAAPAAEKGIVQKTGHFSGSLKLQGGSRGVGDGGWGAGSVLLVPRRPHRPLVPGTRRSGRGLSLAHGEETPKPALPDFGKRGAHTARAWEPRDLCPRAPGSTGPSAFQKPFEASRSWGPLRFRPTRSCQ